MADVPVPDTTAEEEFDLFGPGPAGAAAGAAQPEANPFAPAQGPAPAPAQATALPSSGDKFAYKCSCASCAES